MSECPRTCQAVLTSVLSLLVASFSVFLLSSSACRGTSAHWLLLMLLLLLLLRSVIALAFLIRFLFSWVILSLFLFHFLFYDCPPSPTPNPFNRPLPTCCL